MGIGNTMTDKPLAQIINDLSPEECAEAVRDIEHGIWPNYLLGLPSDWKTTKILPELKKRAEG